LEDAGASGGEAMVSIKRALLLVCGLLVTGPIALFWLWPAAQPEAALHTHVFSVLSFGLLLAALVAIRAGIILTDPLMRLNESAKQIAEGRFDVRIVQNSHTTPRELLQLTNSFNNMAAKLADLSARSGALRERAEKASESKSQFVRTVTHELRQPVNAIIGFSELLTGRGAAKLTLEARDSYLRDINAGARHLLSLVNDLLDLAKMESGQYELIEDEFWIDEITRRACRYVEAQARENGIDVAVTFDGDPPLIRADERAMFQVLLNLVSNGVRYGNRGGHVTMDTRRMSDGSVQIVVADNGPGIAPQDLARVMLPFQRVQSSAKAGVQGSGLGLPIVKQFVELHGGTFELSSIVGAGTTARIILPGHRVLEPAAMIEPVRTVARAA
jgi:two-component system, cell cycle sensor histidine kinase PleC